MKIAVIGAGISGIAAAHGLQREAEVTLFEAARRLGGQSDTHAILTGGRTYRVDSGFTAFNYPACPQFSAWLAQLGVATRPSEVSFGVSNRQSGLEYGTRDMAALFCQRRNLLSPRFLNMLTDLRRLHREAPTVANDDPRTLGQYLDDGGYSAGFVQDHLAPLCSAMWSLPMANVLDAPLVYALGSLVQHRLLQTGERPEWRVVDGGSSCYVAAFAQRFCGRIAIGDPVVSVARQPARVVVTSAAGAQAFDAVVFACRSDQALALLQHPSNAEREVLGAIRYQSNRVVVHSDPSVMPARYRAWSSWNAVVDGGREPSCCVSYWMNRLQSLGEKQQFFVTLNPAFPLADVWSERSYARPLLTAEACRAQQRRAEINGVASTWYCGAYWGAGSHEEGFASGDRVACELRARKARAA
ncbi:MAG: NAD(P)/FAD-dependent oxidoreductase [Pseudomonadales bacterium]